MEKELDLINDKEKKTYEFRTEGGVAAIEYVIRGAGTVFLTHTEVDPQLEGQGVGKELVRQTLEDIERNGMKVVPLCPFVASYMAKHPEWKRLLTEGIQIGK